MKSKEAAPHTDGLRIPAAAWWLPGPHLPTMYSKIVRRIAAPSTRRTQWELPDGDLLSSEQLEGRVGQPHLVVLHGLEGGVHSTYARGFLHDAARRGWSADLVLWRTCDGSTVNRTPRSYHSGVSDDAAWALQRIRAERHGVPILVVGVSLGGNVLLKLLGERGVQARDLVQAAAAVSVPFDLEASACALERGVSRVYGRFFLSSLKRKAREKRSAFPELRDLAPVDAVKTLREFDERFTAPLHGFSGASDYYARCSSEQFLHRIETPTLLLNAVNDPFVPRAVLTRVEMIVRANPWLRAEFPSHGGHVGFVGGRLPWRPEFWMERFVVDWLAQRT